MSSDGQQNNDSEAGGIGALLIPVHPRRRIQEDLADALHSAVRRRQRPDIQPQSSGERRPHLSGIQDLSLDLTCPTRGPYHSALHHWVRSTHSARRSGPVGNAGGGVGWIEVWERVGPGVCGCRGHPVAQGTGPPTGAVPQLRDCGESVCSCLDARGSYCATGAQPHRVAENRPRSLIFRSGITSRAMNDSVMNGASRGEPICLAIRSSVV